MKNLDKKIMKAALCRLFKCKYKIVGDFLECSRCEDRIALTVSTEVDINELAKKYQNPISMREGDYVVGNGGSGYVVGNGGNGGSGYVVVVWD